MGLVEESAREIENASMRPPSETADRGNAESSKNLPELQLGLRAASGLAVCGERAHNPSNRARELPRVSDLISIA